MAREWPPCPSVEDEDTALSREHLHGVSLHRLKSDNQQARSRGSIDQYPIILDNAPDPQLAIHISSAADEQDMAASDTHSSETHPIDTPTDSGPETPPRPEILARSTSMIPLSGDDTPRGRPQIACIQTDIDKKFEGGTTGQGRGPSPYAYKAYPTSGPAESAVEYVNANATLLSPANASIFSIGKEDLNRTPQPEPRPSESSEGNHNIRSTQINRSRSSQRAANNFQHSYQLETTPPMASESKALDPRPRPTTKSGSSPRISPETPLGHSNTSHDSITPPPTPRPKRESGYSSAAEDSAWADSSTGRSSRKKTPVDSPYTSSSEEESSLQRTAGADSKTRRAPLSHRHSRSHAGGRDRAGSRNPPHAMQDAGDHRRREPVTLTSVRTSQAIEAYLEKAFQEDQQTRLFTETRESTDPSPLTSPLQSPQTPRGEREFQDYFDPMPPSAKSPGPCSRPSSIDESQVRDLKPVVAPVPRMATRGESLAARAIPAFPRPSTASSVSQNRLTNALRSQKPSPVYEEPRPISQASSHTSRDEFVVSRTPPPATHGEKFPPRQILRPISPIDQWSPAHRASYPATGDQTQPRLPRHFRALSTTSAMAGPPMPAPLSPSRPILSSPTSPSMVPASPSVTSRPMAMPQCPRWRPSSGLHDWYTVRDLPNLDFCPTCMNFLGGTRFRDSFIPSLYKPDGRAVACAMSRPWVRIAWTESLRQNRPDLSLVRDITGPPPPGTRPCPGTRNDVRRWYHLTDPETGKAIDNMDVCSACVRNVDLVFPELRNRLFERPDSKLSQEKFCSLNTSSKHFFRIISELGRLADFRRWNDLRPKDLQQFVLFIRKIARFRECAKDTMLATLSWHFIPDLPEFTICEECFEEVVWPLKDRPIASAVSKTTRTVPVTRRSHYVTGFSCQLYSERMRKIFRDAVLRNDFNGLRQAARARYDAEQRLQEMSKLYELDQKDGIDRRPELARNAEIWKTLE